jgi:hypothetical protein
VKLINLRNNDSIASVASVPKSEDKDEESVAIEQDGHDDVAKQTQE